MTFWFNSAGRMIGVKLVISEVCGKHPDNKTLKKVEMCIWNAFNHILRNLDLQRDEYQLKPVEANAILQFFRTIQNIGCTILQVVKAPLALNMDCLNYESLEKLVSFVETEEFAEHIEKCIEPILYRKEEIGYIFSEPEISRLEYKLCRRKLLGEGRMKCLNSNCISLLCCRLFC